MVERLIHKKPQGAESPVAVVRCLDEAVAGKKNFLPFSTADPSS